MPTATLTRSDSPIDLLGRCRPSPTEVRRATNQLRRKGLAIVLVAIASYLGLVFVATDLLVALPLAAVLVLALIATGTCVMHDANHGTFGRSRRLNQTISYSGDLLGASSLLWRQKHNVIHHGNTNVVGVDTDIEQMPFARLAPDQPWKPWYRYQHIYIWALYGFLTVQWMVFSDFASIVTGRIGSQTMRQRPRRRDVAKLVAGKLVHVGWAVALPLMYHRWWVVLAFYFACSWVVGFVLALFFQLAHCSEESEFTGRGAARRGDDFVAHQMRTTANIDCHMPVLGTGVAWLMGGLHHQIEHHLAPGIPHTAYPQMSREVRRMCTQLHVEYHEHHGLWSALRSHARWLRKMGRDPAHNPVR